jgi:hypothetical protein
LAAQVVMMMVVVVVALRWAHYMTPSLAPRQVDKDGQACRGRRVLIGSTQVVNSRDTIRTLKSALHTLYTCISRLLACAIPALFLRAAVAF